MQGFGLFKIKKPDLIYAYHPPLTVGVAAIILKKFFNVPLVYDIQDMWPDSLEATGMINSKIIQKVVSIFCSLVYKFSDKIPTTYSWYSLKNNKVSPSFDEIFNPTSIELLPTQFTLARN